MATYNWYFSQAGDDTTGDGSSGDPWKTLVKAKTEIDTKLSTDTVNLFFNRGDTWAMNTLIKTQFHGFEVESTNPIVNMDAYGSGDLSCMDGLITDFSTAPVHDTDSGPLRWSDIFRFSRTDCSVSNMEFKQIYGNVIRLKGASGFQLSNCNIHHFGQDAIQTDDTVINAIIEYNTVHTGQQLWRYALRPSGWGAGISFSGGNCYDNTVRYNLVYDIYGEGIINPGGITEYNLVGDTYSTAIYGSPHAPIDTRDTTIRYNFVTSSNSSDYRVLDGRTSYNGIGIIDERDSEPGSNNNAALAIYGNIVINRWYGIYVKNANVATNDAFKSLKVYNNISIDNSLNNYYFSFPEGVDAGYIYNNSSILYDRVTVDHTNDDFDAGWDVDNNHFWTTGGSPTVRTGWQTNMVTTDPKLSGEPAIDWDGQSGATYYKDIKFSDIMPLYGSALIGSGKTLGAGFEDEFLTTGTDFSGLPDTIAFTKASQPTSWDLGACIFGESTRYARFRGTSIPKPRFTSVGGRFR